MEPIIYKRKKKGKLYVSIYLQKKRNFAFNVRSEKDMPDLKKIKPRNAKP